MDYHKITKEITDLLTKNNFWFETFEHEPVRTSEEAAHVRTGYSLHQGAKAIIIKIKRVKNENCHPELVSGSKNNTFNFVMLVFPGDLKFDNEKVKFFLNVKDIRFATPEEIAKLTGGVEIGGVPPFGNLFGLEVVCDKKLLENEKIVFNAGDRRFSIAIKSEDYKKLVSPKISSIA